MFHCLVIKVVCLRLSADSSFIISLAFCFVKNFFILFFKFFFICISNSDIISCLQFPVNTFFIFFQLYSTKSLLSVKKIRLTQKRIYHIIIFLLRQVLFYIFLHIFYTISDIAIISSFLTTQYQSKDLKIVRICAGRHLDPIPTVHRYQTFLIEDTHKYPD